MTRNHSAEKKRAVSSRLLASLLEHFGEQVLKTGKSLRIAGGTLRLSRRKTRRIRDIGNGELRTVPEVVRLVWRGPVLGVASGPATSPETANKSDQNSAILDR